MAATLPTRFDFPAQGDGQQIAPAKIINAKLEMGQHHVERINRLYAASARPSVLSVAYPTPLRNPATSVVWSPYIRVRWGQGRPGWTIAAWGEYIELQVQLYDDAKATIAGGSTGLMTVGATPALMLGTWTLTPTPTPQTGYVRYGWRENPATPGNVAKLHWLRVLPDVMAAGDIP